MTTLFDQLRHALGEYLSPPVPNPAEAVARCPTCDSWHDTLHLEDRPDGTVALWCDNHCPTGDILEDLGVDPGSVGVTGPSTAAEALAETHAALVDQLAADEYRRLEARDLARRRWDANQRPEPKPADRGRLGAILARPPEPPARIDGLLPWDAAAVLVAKRKVGKTTFVVNLSRCLLTGDDFLDRFPVRRLDGRVGVLNFEVSAAQFAAWANAGGVPHDGMAVANLRGRPNPFAYPTERAELAAWLRAEEVEALVVDPFGRAYTGTSQNDAGEVGAWLTDLDRFARDEVGARDLLLTVHAGWQGERSRGSSALEDWADSIITLTADDESGARYLRALGRDVEVDEDRLDYDPQARRLYLTGEGGRHQAMNSRRRDTARAAILELLETNREGLSGNDLVTMTGRKDGDFTAARDALVEAGKVRRVRRPGRGGGFIYTLHNTQTAEGAEPPANLPNSAPSEPPEPPLYRGEVQVQGSTGQNLPSPSTCTICGLPIPAAIRAEGSTTHPACDLQPAVTP